ncbi:hypothetical protein [Capnocytophaga canimorsus]|uniref:hypothetical protein n=1 Tax=Capnocytophaga canimorsus TaxID=28188 RepID=UPI0037D3CE98
METLKDIFVPYDIAVQLEGIGFDEPCVAVYSKGKLNIFDPNDSVQWVMFEGDFFVPTWEQVKKWFREKNYSYNTYKASDLTHFSEVYKNNNEYLGGTDFFKTYEEAREALIYKLIEIYKNGK